MNSTKERNKFWSASTDESRVIVDRELQFGHHEARVPPVHLLARERQPRLAEDCKSAATVLVKRLVQTISIRSDQLK